MKRVLILVFSVIIMFSLSFCATTPPEEEERPVEEEAPEPVSDEEIKKAEGALEKASWAGAERFASEDYEKASSDLAKAKERAESDPDRARELLASSIEAAHTAYERSLTASYELYKQRIQEKQEQLAEIDADKFRPQKSEDLYDRYLEADRLYQEGNPEEAKEAADDLLNDLDTFYDELNSRITYALSVKEDARKAIDQAEEEKSEEWAPDAYLAATKLFDQGTEAYNNYNLEKSIEKWEQAKNRGMYAAELASERSSTFEWYFTRFTNYYELLKELEADMFRPQKSEELYKRFTSTKAYFYNDQYEQAKTAADSLLEDLRTFYENLDEQIRWAKILRRDAVRNRENARDAEAQKWSPAEYSTGQRYFDRGVTAFSTYKLEESIEQWDKAKYYYLIAARQAPERKQQYQNYMARLERVRKRLAELNADKFEPEKTNRYVNRIDNAKKLYSKGDYEKAREEAGRLVEDLETFYRDLRERVNYAKSLQNATENNMDRAEEVEAYVWSPGELQKAMLLYTNAVSEYREFNLEKSIGLLKEAKELAQKAVQLAPIREGEHETGNLMEQVRKDIEEASELTIMTEEGEVIVPEEEEEAELEGRNQSMIENQTAVYVAGDVSEADLLSQAKELWIKGVEARDKGNYEQAKAYFEQAGRLTHRYKSMAIGKTKSVSVYKDYTLWFIAEKEYGSPFLWPYVWVMNMDRIEDPDLIYPSWKVLVPLR
jgi:hypothetical protein